MVSTGKGGMMHDQAESTPLTGPGPTYQAYLLRLWRGGVDEPWRVLLRSVTTKEEQVFPDLAGLVAFLETGRDVKRTPPEIDEIGES